jgi:hypothetical protein
VRSRAGRRHCALAAELSHDPPKASTATTVQKMIDECFMADILFADCHEEYLVILPANGN